jgi:hypothetical protein
MADWQVDSIPDWGLLTAQLPEEARKIAATLASEIAVARSLEYPEGHDFEGPSPGLASARSGRLMMEYLTDPRGERILVVQVTWLG